MEVIFNTPSTSQRFPPDPTCDPSNTVPAEIPLKNKTKFKKKRKGTSELHVLADTKSKMYQEKTRLLILECEGKEKENKLKDLQIAMLQEELEERKEGKALRLSILKEEIFKYKRMDVIQEPPIKRKRGVVNPSKYQRNRIKSSRSQGKEYVNYKGHVVHAKAIGNSCNCPLKCVEKVNEENRNNVFKTFYEIATKNEQDIYLQGQIEVCSVRRRTTNAQEDEKRARSYYHFVKINGKNVKVCRKAFLILFKKMPRKLKPRKYGTATAESMSKAVDLVLNKKYSVRQAAVCCNVKYPTFQRYVMKKQSNLEGNKNGT
ncbi:hypothetical protein RN001_005954 [Aquatica leii]|uniref:HTH psq-type domain-containing protein n=1 Tax=Aquatica leii TaxID=1421715 RepID=A0AAN7Q8G1_9COLE|nr:hypothetical protein RN001_005954 [Aquatica leii]